MRNPWLAGLCGVLLLLGTGCQNAPAALTPTQLSTLTPTLIPTSQPETAVPSTPEPVSLIVWLPDVLFPLDDDSLSALLTAEVNEFSTQSDVQIELRRKKPDDVGGPYEQRRWSPPAHCPTSP